MIGVTGASGNLGRLVVNELLDGDVPADEIVAVVRSPEKVDDLRSRGVQVRRGDYEEPDTLRPALEGVDRLLLISSSEVGRRAAQHRNVVKAAADADVELLAYTSILECAESEMQLAAEHQDTETTIRESGIPFVFLRNGWYLENYTEQIPQYLEHGAILGSAGDGRVSAATRADYAAAAAAVLTGTGYENTIHELGGDEAFTMSELADELSTQSGRTIAYRNLPVDDYAEVLVGAGIPENYARVLADSDLGVARGDLFTESGDLSRLIGRPTTRMPDAVAAQLRG